MKWKDSPWHLFLIAKLWASVWCWSRLSRWGHDNLKFWVVHKIFLSWYSDWLQAGHSRDQILVGWDFPPIWTGPGAHTASCTMGTRYFLGVKYGQGMLLTTHPLLVSWSWKSRAIPLPTHWATTRPVTGTLYLIIKYSAFIMTFQE